MKLPTGKPICLGKQTAKHDVRTLRLERYLDPSLPVPPSIADNSGAVSPWQMFGNDQYGDCVVAGWAHAINLWSTLAGKPDGITDKDVEQLYFQLTGGPDSGLVILDSLQYLMAHAWEGRQILGYAKVDIHNTNLVKTAISIFKCVYRGVLLPVTAQGQSDPGKTWSVVSKRGNGAPGSWGGHCIIDVGYDSAKTKCITWGYAQSATWNFWDVYGDEAYVIIPTDPIPGFNQDAFIRDLQEIGAYVGPPPSPPAPPAPPTPPTPTPPSPPTPEPPTPVGYSAEITVKGTDGSSRSGTALLS